MKRDDQERDDARQPLPFEGLHVYQRAQEAWAMALALSDGDPLWSRLEAEIREGTLGIARATARSRTNGDFGTALETARGSLHAAAAVLDQMARRGTPTDPQLRVLLVDGSRMLGALVRSLSQPRGEAVEEAAA